MLRAALWSVLHQTYRDFEVVVSDNASDDDLEAEVLATNDTRVRYFKQKENIGGAANFRFLQTVATGEYVLFLGSDDLLLPNCLEKAVDALDTQPQRGGVVYMAAHYNAHGFEYLSAMPDRGYATGEEYEDDLAVRDFPYASPTLCLYRRSTFERLGGWDATLLAVIDLDLYSKMIRFGGGMIYLHEVLAIMRLHDDRMSTSSDGHWDFYHDVMLLAAKPELLWKHGYRARAVATQLLLDWRQGRSPYRTLQYIYRTGAVGSVLFYMPWEILRRAQIKLRLPFERRTSSRTQKSTLSGRPANFDRNAFDAFWRTSEHVRGQGAVII